MAKVELTNEYMINQYVSDEEIDEDDNEENDDEIIIEPIKITDSIKALLEKVNEEDNKTQKLKIERNEIVIDKKNKNKKNVLTLINFTKKINDEEENKKPKKFVSKRTDDKKKNENIIINKRVFNPRKPPYNFIHKNNNKTININDINEFPSLN